MRLHTDTLTDTDLTEAARTAGVWFLNREPRGSRSRDHAFEVALTGSSAHRTGYRDGGEFQAATWDEWGIFLGVLFARDPRMLAGSADGYRGAADYHWQTGHRFEDRRGPDAITPGNQHRQHRWGSGGRVASGAYYVAFCRCGALRRYLDPTSGITRADLGLEVPEHIPATV